MNRHASALSAAIAATLGTIGVPVGTTYTATLVGDTSYSNNGSSAANLSTSTATWSYDDATGQLTQTGGTFNARFTITPTTTLFRHLIEGLLIGNGAAATASAYSCVEGNLGTGVGASLCGNYNFGANFVNETTATWGPGVWQAFLAGDRLTQESAQAVLTAKRQVLELYPPAPPLLKAAISCLHDFPQWAVRPPLMPLSPELAEQAALEFSQAG